MIGDRRGAGEDPFRFDRILGGPEMITGRIAGDVARITRILPGDREARR